MKTDRRFVNKVSIGRYRGNLFGYYGNLFHFHRDYLEKKLVLGCPYFKNNGTTKYMLTYLHVCYTKTINIPKTTLSAYV